MFKKMNDMNAIFSYNDDDLFVIDKIMEIRGNTERLFTTSRFKRGMKVRIDPNKYDKFWGYLMMTNMNNPRMCRGEFIEQSRLTFRVESVHRMQVGDGEQNVYMCSWEEDGGYYELPYPEDILLEVQ